MSLTQQDILDFEKAVVELAKVKSTELKLRKKIINHFRYNGKIEGVQHKSIEGLDLDIAITLKLTRKIDKDGLESIWVNLDKAQKDVIRYNPSLDLTGYKKLLENGEQGELMNVITETPALASVKLKFKE